METKYYIRIPLPNGEWEYRPVERERLDVRVLTELYERKPVHSSSGWQWVRVWGVRPDVPLPDIAPLKSEIDEWLGDIRHQLASLPQQETVKAVAEQLLEGFPLGEVLRALADLRPEEARTRLLDFLHPLGYGIMTIAGLLAKKAEEAQRLETHADAMSDVADRSKEDALKTDERLLGIVCDMGAALSDLVEIAQDFAETEREISELLVSVRAGIPGLADLMNEDDEEIAGVVEELDNPEEGFWPKAMQFLHTPKSVPDMRERLSRARNAISVVRNRHALATEEQQTRSAAWLRSLEELRGESETLLAKLRKATNDANDLLARYGKGGLLPWEHRNGSLVSKELYERALEILGDGQWSPIAAEARIRNALANAMRLMPPPPMFSKKLRGIVDRASDRAAEVESKLERLTPRIPTAPADPPRKVLVAGPPGSDESPEEGVRNAPPAQIDQSRLEAIYEQVICVGLAVTANTHHLKGTTIRKMCKVLRAMDRITPEEFDTYSAPLRSFADQNREDVEEGGKVAMRTRKSSRATWVYYPDPSGQGHRRWKLTVYAEPFAEECMVRHGLERESIVAAYGKVRSEELAERLASRGLEIPPSPPEGPEGDTT